MATNLSCQPCKDQHHKITELMKIYPNRICLRLRLTRFDVGKAASKNLNQYVFSYWLQNIKGKKNEALLTKNLIHDWFELFDDIKFKDIYPVDTKLNLELVKKIENQHKQWFKSDGIFSTPTILINGYTLPTEYSITSLLPLLPMLEEKLKKHKKELEVI